MIFVTDHIPPAFTNPVDDRERQRRHELRESDEHDLRAMLPAIQAALIGHEQEAAE